MEEALLTLGMAKEECAEMETAGEDLADSLAEVMMAGNWGKTADHLTCGC